MQIFSPASPRDAIDLIQTYQPTLDTTGAQALFATPSLQRLFDRGHRAPDRVWALRTDDPDTRGLVAARLMGNMALVDMLALPSDDDAATSLLETATRW